jgi:hypothetical protein
LWRVWLFFTACRLIVDGCAHDNLVPLRVLAQISITEAERMLALRGVLHQTVGIVGEPAARARQIAGLARTRTGENFTFWLDSPGFRAR